MIARVLTVTATEQTVTCDANREYTFYHLNVDNENAANSEHVYLSDGEDTAPDADLTEGANKIILKAGVAVSVRLDSVRLVTASGTVAVQMLEGRYTSLSDRFKTG